MTFEKFLPTETDDPIDLASISSIKQPPSSDFQDRLSSLVITVALLSSKTATDTRKTDIVDRNYPAYVCLMSFYSFLDPMWQAYAYWLMGKMSSAPASWLCSLASVCIDLEIEARVCY
ncbi:hypothetical protein AZE42_06558 [Rhizopogon vesiculosus]|uniref:Uncharacterized protein n=1 Tax=Rhizopogon vesiculosus TaxID=180088 RepID=A0A1J8Q6W9_9AGAM|nr:hypothetical protein AZE42_06558 [Rhizopogon vesiculosus]